jgi:hypothetical protein
MFFNGVLTETVAELLNNELRIWEKTRREAERVTNLGKDPAGSRSTGPSWSQGVGRWPLRGNQEAPSQPGGHARCASRNTAFVRAPWVGPPNRASPMRGFVIALGKLRAVRGVCRSSRLDRASPMRAFVIARGTRCAAVGSCRSLPQNRASPIWRSGLRLSTLHAVLAPWVGPPNRASPMRAFVIVLGTLRGSWRCRSSRPKQGVAGACVRRRSQSVLCGEARMLWAAAKLVSWVVVPIVALPTLRRAATPQLHPSPVAVRRSQIGGPTLDM